ncbi:MAG: hypothetical protein ABI939_06020, partial [Anaerolineaceae bacterium]
MKMLFLVAPLALAFSLAACGDDDAKPTPGPTVASTTTSAAVTAAPSFATSTRPAPTPAADGTVDALGPGDTETKTVQAQPGEFSGQALLKDVRMGVHPEVGGWDRIVFEFSGPNLPPATIGYLPVATQCGSG